MDKAKHKLWHQLDWGHTLDLSLTGGLLWEHQLSLPVLIFPTKMITLHGRIAIRIKWNKVYNRATSCARHIVSHEKSMTQPTLTPSPVLPRLVPLKRRWWSSIRQRPFSPKGFKLKRTSRRLGTDRDGYEEAARPNPWCNWETHS